MLCFIVVIAWLLLISGVLIANKSDLDQRRAVSVMDGREKALSKGLEYFECSAVSRYVNAKFVSTVHC